MRRSLILATIGVLVLAIAIFLFARSGNHDPTFESPGPGRVTLTALTGESDVPIREPVTATWNSNVEP